MRIYSIFIVGLLLLPWMLKANEASSFESNAPTEVGAEAASSSINNVSAIMVGCDLDRKCMQAMLEEISQNNTNALYQNLLLVLASQQEQIDDEASACQVEEIRVLRKDAAYCISEAIERVNKNVSPDGGKSELSACIQQKMEGWAKKGNLFAQSLLANRATKQGDTNAQLYWEKLIQNQAGTPVYETFIKCSRSFQLIPPGISEVTFQSLKKVQAKQKSS